MIPGPKPTHVAFQGIFKLQHSLSRLHRSWHRNAIDRSDFQALASSSYVMKYVISYLGGGGYSKLVWSGLKSQDVQCT